MSNGCAWGIPTGKGAGEDKGHPLPMLWVAAHSLTAKTHPSSSADARRSVGLSVPIPELRSAPFQSHVSLCCRFEVPGTGRGEGGTGEEGWVDGRAAAAASCFPRSHWRAAVLQHWMTAGWHSEEPAHNLSLTRFYYFDPFCLSSLAAGCHPSGRRHERAATYQQ